MNKFYIRDDEDAPDYSSEPETHSLAGLAIAVTLVVGFLCFLLGRWSAL
jgi:hypothetical protein